ncbi:hypothetical protein OS493_022149 [Desmophyllum pertusum]|uniref:Uncharacterized protein n=1 Tax=Desmophyllum pertusum TaxID=174260 RepID=A0A9W9YMF6_9CNID|nr:hypothetical protein OS493_022149 [Desmophyllum pertusum]
MMLKLTLACFVIACFLAAEAARIPGPYYRDPEPYNRDLTERFFKNHLHRRSCVPLGGSGCEGNNGKCCRQGNPYTGIMRKCVNVGSVSSPNYVCQD